MHGRVQRAGSDRGLIYLHAIIENECVLTGGYEYAIQKVGRIKQEVFGTGEGEGMI